jgi:pseudouridine-5'-monophosphatase
MNVVWVPDESLRALDPNETHGAHVTIEHLAEFRPEQWGLPAFEDSNRLQGTVDA